MTRDELNSLIDRVIGKKGIMRASAWWVGRLLKDIVDFTDKRISSQINTHVGSADAKYAKKIVVDNVNTYTTGAVLQHGTFTKFNTPLGNMALTLNSTNEYPEYYAEIMFGEKDSSNLSIESGGLEIYWDRKDAVGKNRKCVVSIDGPIGTVISSSRPYTHYVLTYNATSTTEATTLFDTTPSTGIMYIDGVKQKSVVSSYTFSTLGEHRIDIYIEPGTVPGMCKIFRYITALTGYKLYHEGALGSDWESAFEGTSFRSPNWTEVRSYRPSFYYGQMFQACSNLDARYLNADCRNMELVATGRTVWIFDIPNYIHTLDLSTWDFAGSSGNAGDAAAFYNIGRVIGSSKYGSSGEVGPSFYIESRMPVAVFFDNNGNAIRNENNEDTDCDGGSGKSVMYWYEFNSLHLDKYGLPSVPTVSGFDGHWNLTLNEIKNRLTKYGYCEVGAVYEPSNPATEFSVNITEENGTSMKLSVYTYGENGDDITINWGDGNTETVTLTTKGSTAVPHTYAAAGNYIISINSTNYGFELNSIYGVITTTNSGGTTSTTNNYYYDNEILTYSTKMYAASTSYFKYNNLTSMTDSVSYQLVPYKYGIRSYDFNLCPSATFLSLPDTPSTNAILNLKMNNREYDYDLLNVTIPEGYGTIAEECFHQCKYLQHAVLPTTLHTIGAKAFNYCYSLRKVVFPGSISEIGSQAFGDCFRIREYDFSNCTSVPTIPEDAFPHISGTAVKYYIYVPGDKVSAWKNKYSHYNWVENIVAAGSISKLY